VAKCNFHLNKTKYLFFFLPINNNYFLWVDIHIHNKKYSFSPFWWL